MFFRFYGSEKDWFHLINPYGINYSCRVDLESDKTIAGSYEKSVFTQEEKWLKPEFCLINSCIKDTKFYCFKNTNDLKRKYNEFISDFLSTICLLAVFFIVLDFNGFMNNNISLVIVSTVLFLCTVFLAIFVPVKENNRVKRMYNELKEQ